MSVHAWIKTVVTIDPVNKVEALELERDREDGLVKMTAYFGQDPKLEAILPLEDLKKIHRSRNSTFRILGREEMGYIRVTKEIARFSKHSRICIVFRRLPAGDFSEVIIKTSDLGKALRLYF